jgi:hypothetical protein
LTEVDYLGDTDTYFLSYTINLEKIYYDSDGEAIANDGPP